ncbi:single-stranded DNA-binding protein [Thermodesulfitimonas autotrophica]|uniref:single-stranded DNA-binding protein n=1 Tax=Thermodesulfitimonas autotrophica TaxID=1894989 RepID=UPI002FE23D5F
MLNRIILIGRLVRDPELRYTPSGTAVAGFTIAVDRPYTARQGERQTDFIDIVVWQKQAEVCHRNLTKGRLVAVEGRLQVRSYEDNQGIRRKAAEVVADTVRFLDRPREGEKAPEGAAPNQEGEFPEPFGQVVDFSEDDIPF